MSDPSLYGVFSSAADIHPHRRALEVEGEVLNYAQLRERAQRVAATLVAGRAQAGLDGPEVPPLTAVLAHRSTAGFAGILGALASGHGYVPMLPSLPAARIVLMLERSGARSLFVDDAGAEVLDAVLAGVSKPLLVVMAESKLQRLEGAYEAGAMLDERYSALKASLITSEALKVNHPRHTFISGSEMAAAPAGEVAPRVSPDDIAYLLFTSGSTGEPKGVMVAHRNIARFLDVVVERYDLRETDRFTHLFEITFDLSLFDLFACWKVGGCLCVADARQRLLPTQYIMQSEITVWFSVPSAALLMKRMGALVPGVFSDLRVVLFCGEALPLGLAQSFAAAAPQAVFENIYGPTELTLACTAYRWTEDSPAESENEIVPIGEPFPGMRAKVVDEELAEVEPGQSGELIMAGPQRALGYWNDPERTAAAFLVPPGESEIFYRTGDRVRRPHPGKPMIFLGRMDSQIKINGYRVELGEIEAVIQREAKIDVAVVVGWPKRPGGAAGVVGFITAKEVAVDDLLDRLEVQLPRYMVPKEIRVIDEWPLNPNGKIDRKALEGLLT